MKFHVVVLLICVLATVYLTPWTNGFNVETKNCAIYAEERKSMFGFSVAEHIARDNFGRREGWVIVGAPEAHSYQRGVYRGGVVYRCQIDKDNACTPIDFDLNGNNYNANPEAPGEVDNKTLQWFGATVSTSQETDGPILACAPRYIWYSANFARREPVGTCYITQHSFRESKEFSPCRTKHWGYHRQGSCQAGLGAALSKDGERVHIGAPGSFYWQGQVYSIDSNAEFTYLPPRLAHFGESGQILTAPTNSLIPNIRSKPVVLSTNEGQARDDDTYLGYSVTTGDFEGNGEIGTAVGMPRGFGLHGQVVIFTSNLTNYQKNLTGDQMGAYFGYSVIACDVNSDGLDDLIVGAPMYTIDNPGETFETGRVHIFYQGNGVERFSRTETRVGFKTRSRFGLSLASLNDIDYDGFGDFAVGAPYDGPEGRGAVYIYHGSKDGVLEKYSQVIYAEDVRSTVSTFGFSIGGGLDLDGNQYPDMVVGAYESSTAAFFRSRPVIKVDAWVEFDSQSKSISLDERNCVISTGVRVACLQLKTCVTYTGIGVERSYQFNIEYALDTKKTKSRRLFFRDFEKENSINQTVLLSRDEQFCKSFMVYLEPNITDKLTSIDAEMRMSLVENKASALELRNPSALLTPVLGSTTSQLDSLLIFKNCGSDNICTPNLGLKVTSPISKYLLESGDTLEIDVLVTNTGEPAYEALYYLEKPAGLEYINIERINKTEIPVQCSAPSADNNQTLKCDIGNPLPQNEAVHFKVILQPIKSEGSTSRYDIDMGVNSTNPEDNNTLSDNKYHFEMPIWILTDLVIEGSSRPKDLYYNATNYTVENITSELEFGPLLTHNYTIRNDGPSEMIEAEASLTWPAATLSGEELLYLIDKHETVGRITCGPPNVNYLGLTLERRAQYVPPIKVTEIDRINQLAEAERRKQNEEHQNFASINGTSRDYDAEAEVVVTSTGSKNISTSHFSNYTNRGGYSTEEEHRISTNSQGQGQYGNEKEQWESAKVQFQQLKEKAERERIEAERRQFAERQRIAAEESERLRLQKEESDRLRIEAERLSFLEAQRIAAEQKEEEQRRIAESIARQHLNRNEQWRVETEPTHGVERHYTTDTENIRRQNTGYGITSGGTGGGVVREEYSQSGGNSGLSFNSSNIISSTDLEKFFSTTNHEAPAITTYTRGGKEYVQFEGRFRVGGGEEYIQFKNGQSYKVLDRNGQPSITDGRSQSIEFRKIEGQIVGGEDGKIYIELEDGRKFIIPGTYTYQRKHTYSVSTGPQETSGQQRYVYGRRVTHEGSSGDDRVSEPYGINNFKEGSYKEEYQSGKRIISRINTGGIYDSVGDFYGGDNVPTVRPEDRLNRYARESDVLNIEQFRNFERNERQKRDVDEIDFYGDISADDLEDTQRFRRDDADVIGRGQVSSCKSAQCVKLVCTIGPLKKGEEVSIKVRYRVKAKTLNKIAFNENLQVSTQLVTRVLRQEFIGNISGEKPTKSHEIITTIHPSAAPAAPDVVPLWVVVLSACAGTIILLLLIFLLYKIGFFKRNRPNSAPERQPLNRNGHYSNDD